MKKILTIVVLLVSMICTASADNKLSAAIVDGRLSISMTNDVTVTAYDLHLYLPTGAGIAQVWNEDDEEYVNDIKMGRTKSDHALTVMKDNSDDSYLLGVASPTIKTIKNNEGEILSIALNLSKVADGSYTCALKKIWLAFPETVGGVDGIELDNVEFPIDVKGGAITGINGVGAEGSFKLDGKYYKNGEIIIKKGNKEYNAVGAIKK